MDTERDAIRTYLRAFGWVLLVVAWLPFDFYLDDPLWPWQGVADGTWSEGLAVMLPLCGAVLFGVLARLKWSKLVLAACVLGGLAAAWLVEAWSSSVAHPLGVYEHLTDGLPLLFSRAFWLLLLGMGLLAAGVRLGARGFQEPLEGRPRLADPWGAARLITGVGIALVVLFYFLPHRGGVPLFTLVAETLAHASGLTDAAGLALLAGRILSLGPLLLAAFAVVRLWRRAPDHGGMLLTLLVCFLPLLTLLVGMRNFAVLAAYTLPHLRAAALMLAVTLGVCLAVSVLVRGLWYEIPWSFGQLTRVDRVLLSVLAAPDPSAALARTLERLHPLVRPFVRRRLRLWQSAVEEVPGEGQSDLVRVMRLLEDRWREEQAMGQALVPRWPRWMLGRRIELAAATGTAVVAVLTLLAVHQPPEVPAWSGLRDSAALERVFSSELPGVISGLSRCDAELDTMPRFAGLRRTLREAERDCPGLHDAVVHLLRVGSRGRRRLHSIWRARDRLNHLMQRHDVPYFVRSQVRAGRGCGGRDLFYTLSYRVQDCRWYHRRGERTRLPVLHLVRTDDLNVIESYMGTTDEAEAYVTILLGRLEVFLEHNLLPLLRRDDPVGQAARRGLRRARIALDSEEAARADLAELMIEGLTRHELHHLWMGLEPEPPTALWAWLRDYAETTVRGVASELGAFLGELALGPGYARTRLAIMIDALERHAGHRGHHGLARIFVLSKLLGLDIDGPPQWQAYLVVSRAHRLASLADAELAERVATLHRELFGTEAPVFEPVDIVPSGS